MKKIYTLSFVLFSLVSFSQSIVITKVVDGTLASDGCAGTTGTSNPKIVELYVSGSLDLTNYRVQSESNGAADAASIAWNIGTDLTPLGTVTNSFIYLVGAGATTFSEMYPNITLPTGLTNLPNGNGNDALRIVLTDGVAPTPAVVAVVDQFGNPLDIPGGSTDFTAAWAYQDSYASRKSGIANNKGTFVNDSFTYGGNGAFAAPNNTCDFIKGAITLSSNKFDAISGLKVYPNPVTKGNLYISSSSIETKSITIFDVLGKQVLKSNVTNQVVNVSSLKSGVYVLKITEEGKTATRKLIIQ